jgi:hypothetical protein
VSVAIIRHLLLSMLKSETKNDMEAEFLNTNNGDSSLCSGRADLPFAMGVHMTR